MSNRKPQVVDYWKRKGCAPSKASMRRLLKFLDGVAAENFFDESEWAANWYRLRPAINKLINSGVVEVRETKKGER